ncbi:MAG: hypothetical protein LBE20_05405 [Deltaproteobacteria bacterium]|nr:hypothetical protein [Deltaproteobacteria bacterium]
MLTSSGLNSLATSTPGCDGETTSGVSVQRVKQPFADCNSISSCKTANTIGAVDHATATFTCKDNTCYTWRLVSRATIGGVAYEVWHDDVGLTWSARIINGSTQTFNWCHASGANNGVGNAYASNDPNDYCDSSSYQNQTNPISLCKEENYSEVLYAKNSKGGLGGWYLPTVNDYLLARKHGIRRVLGDMNNEWTSTVYGDDTRYAWYFGSGGQFDSIYNRNYYYYVRCVTAVVVP